MTKYNEQFRLQLVEACLCEGATVGEVAARHGVDYSMLRRWVASYREHGSAGLRRKYSRYDMQFKMTVLQRMWRDGLSLREVTALFDIRSPGIVAQWERLYHEGGVDALSPAPRGRPRKMTASRPDKPIDEAAPDTRTREELLKENEFLRAEVAYLKKLDALLKAKKRAAQKKKRK
jgi:transposase